MNDRDKQTCPTFLLLVIFLWQSVIGGAELKQTRSKIFDIRIIIVTKFSHNMINHLHFKVIPLSQNLKVIISILGSLAERSKAPDCREPISKV